MPKAQTASSFTDTDNAHIKILNEAGIINGKTQTEFAPDDLLTREEAAVILNRMVNKTISVPVTEMYFIFDDEANISDWALDSIQIMCNMGVMNGVSENKFAPKSTYTTEQAIATIVRVYAAQSANTGIIGGADEPIEIYVGKDIEVSDFYIKEAIKHSKKAGELAGTKEFVSLYVTDEDEKAYIEKLSHVDFETPEQMYYLSYNIDKVIDYYNEMLAKEKVGEEFDVKRYLELNRFSLSYLANRINARYGSKTLVATSVLTSREGYIMPKDFEKDFGVYLKYEGEYSALVTFTKIGEGVIEARMQFVKNSDKEDIKLAEEYQRMYKDVSYIESTACLISDPYLKEIFFNETTPAEAMIEKGEDGWYRVPQTITASFPWFEVGNKHYPSSVTAYFTESGTQMDSYKKQIGRIKPPYLYRTMAQVLSMKLQFPNDAPKGHLWFVFEFEDGSIETSEIYNILPDFAVGE